MDPKMDSACSDPHEEAAELYDVRRELLPDEVLGIMDQLLCHEVLSSSPCHSRGFLLTSSRWRGIWDTPYPRPSSRACTSRRS